MFMKLILSLYKFNNKILPLMTLLADYLSSLLIDFNIIKFRVIVITKLIKFMYENYAI